MKKILLINNGYPSEKNIHYVSYIKSIKECLEEAGFEVDLLVMSSAFKSNFEKLKCYLSYYFKLLQFKNYKNYNYIYINNYPHSFLPLIFRFHEMEKVIIHWHGDDIESNDIIKKLFNKTAYLFVPSKAIHISPSKYFSKGISECLNIKRENIFISPSGGVDVSLFKPFEKKDNNLEVKIKIGFSSHLSPEKGINLIIELIKKVNTLNFNTPAVMEFHYIKYGSEKEKYSKILKEIPNTVEHSIYKKEDMPIFYNTIDLFLFPTKRDSLGSVGLEAMSCGLPVLGTNDFAIKEYVKPGIDGELFNVGDYQSFEENFVKCINNIQKYTPRKTIIEEYSKEIVIKKYKQFLV